MQQQMQQQPPHLAIQNIASLLAVGFGVFVPTVPIVSKHNNDEHCICESSAGGFFMVQKKDIIGFPVESRTW